MKDTISISTYHEYVLEATSAFDIGLKFNSNITNGEEVIMLKDPYIASMFFRYSFLMICNSLEAAANSLLISLNLEKDYYIELEKLGTLLKFKIFCEMNGFRLDSGDTKYSNIKELVFCRNEFVHPKPHRVNYKYHPITGELEMDVKKTSNREYPIYFNNITLPQTVSALKDCLSFLSWIIFDICKFSVREGALKLGLNSFGSTGDIYTIESKLNIKFDKRTFGIE
jgi:hypothetical protein